MWEPITGVTAIVALIISLISFGINLYDRSRKNMRMSWNQLEQEIARICRKHSMYKLIGDGDLGFISDQITKKFKNRLPEDFRWEHRDDRVVALARFLNKIGWQSGQENFGTCRVIYELPNKLRSP